MTEPTTAANGAKTSANGTDAASDATTYEAAKAKANAAVESSRETAHDLSRQAAATIETNPLAVVAGGLALGALVAAVLPRSQREKELLAPVGRRVNATAVAAFAAAKEVGLKELDSRGLTPGAAKDQARTLLQEFAKAAGNAGKAAAQAGREQAKG